MKIRFKDGYYETSDKEEIRALRRDDHVVEVPAGALPEREASRDEGLLPPIPESSYPPDAEPLEPYEP